MTGQFSCSLTSAVVFSAVVFLTAAASFASSEKVIYNFQSSTGANPWSSLVFDSAGNLYGTTQDGGMDACDGGCGTVFELTPDAGGGWTNHVIHIFGNYSDGIYPTFSSGLVLDAAGNIYGTTLQGGIHGDGTVFELSPIAGGSWSEKVLHSFAGDADGASPQAGLSFDAAGNLYGTTLAGGIFGLGTIFELKPKAGGGWGEVATILDNFSGEGGASPYAPVIADSAGNLYGTVSGGGNGYGLVFELFPGSDGHSSVEEPLWTFSGGRGHGKPEAGLLRDAAGNLYGTASDDGLGQSGAVFKVAPSAGGNWTESIIHTFGYAGDGTDPRSGLVQDAAGSLYGTTYSGGAHGAGAVYKLIPNSNGTWTENIVYSFTGGADGGSPIGGVILDQAGHIYGTTVSGGSNGAGVVFEVKQ